MALYTIAEEPISKDELRRLYSYFITLNKYFNHTDLDYIFNIAIENPDYFPGINVSNDRTPRNYINRWIRNYFDSLNNPPSKRTANPKTACSDPAIAVIVRTTQGMSESQTITGENNHNLFMSAENIQGNLLEEYIALKARPYGFLWCTGNVLRATDFCTTDGSLLLQIKNKSNTENSSSSNIREGTTIEKWYRLGTTTRKGVKYPNFKWPSLNTLINTYRTEGLNLPSCNMSEEEYEEYLKKVSSANHSIITYL